MWMVFISGPEPVQSRKCGSQVPPGLPLGTGRRLVSFARAAV